MFISELKFKRHVQLDLKGSAVHGYDLNCRNMIRNIDSIYILDDYISKPNACFS